MKYTIIGSGKRGDKKTPKSKLLLDETQIDDGIYILKREESYI